MNYLFYPNHFFTDMRLRRVL